MISLIELQPVLIHLNFEFQIQNSFLNLNEKIRLKLIQIIWIPIGEIESFDLKFKLVILSMLE